MSRTFTTAGLASAGIAVPQPRGRAASAARPAETAKARKPRDPHAGKHLERILAAPQSGVLLTQVPQAARVVRGKAGKTFTLRVRGACDFFGCLPGGRLVVLDAKETKCAGVLETRDDHLPQHQRASLVGYGRRGAVAGLMVLHSRTGRILWCPWWRLLDARPSVPLSEMVVVAERGRSIDWALASPAGRDGTEGTNA